ncbi:site-specific DNA-methyltransferase [Maridesulfovibrio ferrireducens]|uniref:site-specific DNA-methyltransferase n=1 Tax=Maridesulfovibrio ferrireducens TaxID=246191 RepID=UPI001A1A0173|nr:site-specific DNA-methyltransferase [Maridesulfovibrio ferrireducens]MBI9112744.1 site-specific DNA-methyltransferase [Maridesulfovibrio ferrireducens]
MQKLDPNTDGKTMDIVTENISKLKELFPEAFTEGKVDFDALKEVLGEYVEDREERYSFTWNGKSKARMLAQNPSTGTLRPCPEESVNFDTTQNLFIEGDNLEVLKLLQKSYYGKIKMIYIDPPYNTGNDFVYPDNFQDNIRNYLELTGQITADGFKISPNSETNGRYHTDWLNMMYPRLVLARNLLMDSGSIWISIDDHELSNLINMARDVFGDENFVSCFIWQKRKTRENRKVFSVNHDYIVCFAKNIKLFETTRKLLPLTEEARARYKNPDNDSRGDWQSVAITAQAGHGTKNQFYSITTPSGKVVELPSGNCWRFTKEKVEKMAADNRIWFGTNGDNVPRQKVFLDEIEAGLTPHTMWLAEEVNTTDYAKRRLNEMFDGKAVFETPKPVELIKRIMQISDDPDGIFLDFFSGSCPTAHASFELNITDDGSRKFIMVQLPEPCLEKTIAHIAGYKTIAEIGKERIRRVIKKIKAEQEEKKTQEATTLPGMSEETQQLDLGFKVLKLDSTNIKPWEVDFDNYESTLEDYITNIKSDRSEEDVLYEILLKYGLDLTLPIEERIIADKKVFIVGLGALVLCLADGITLDVVEGIAELKEEFSPEDDMMRVVFKDNGFDNDVVKTNTIQILRQHGITDVKSL